MDIVKPESLDVVLEGIIATETYLQGVIRAAQDREYDYGDLRSINIYEADSVREAVPAILFHREASPRLALVQDGTSYQLHRFSIVWGEAFKKFVRASRQIGQNHFSIKVNEEGKSVTVVSAMQPDGRGGSTTTSYKPRDLGLPSLKALEYYIRRYI